MVRCQLLLHAIAHNLVRRLMGEGSRQTGTMLDRVGFKGTLDTFRQWHPGIAAAAAGANRAQRLRAMLQLCGTDAVPERPGRTEPRAVKRRPKPFPRLTRPRDEMRREPLKKRYKGKRKPETQPRTPHKSWILK